MSAAWGLGARARGRNLLGGLGLGLGLGLAACGALEPPVARTVDGVTSEGRFIEPDAYALYAVAALREARGQSREALELYQRALRFDSRGPELHTRVGAVACRLRQNAVAARAFKSALDADREYGPLWYEMALCHRAQGELASALDAAREALRLDPERYATSLLLAELTELQGDRVGAWRIRDALATHAPGSLQVQRQLLDLAERASDRARASRARQALAELTRHGAATPQKDGIARALAALGRGEAENAQREAEQLLGADPGNGDALVIALSAADLQQDHAAFARLLEHAGEPGKPASPAVLSALEALLSRRVSAQAAALIREH